MPIPDYQAIMLPSLLSFASDTKEHSLREAIDTLADNFSLSDDERKELLPSGQQAIFTNRVAWARTYLKQAGLIEATRRGFFKISQRGLGVLKKKPTAIDIKFLEQFPEFLEFRNRRKDKDELAESAETSQKTPEESLESAYQKLRYDLGQELLRQVRQCTPSFLKNWSSICW
jgi:restriction system protein